MHTQTQNMFQRTLMHHRNLLNRPNEQLQGSVVNCQPLCLPPEHAALMSSACNTAMLKHAVLPDPFCACPHANRLEETHKGYKATNRAKLLVAPHLRLETFTSLTWLAKNSWQRVCLPRRTCWQSFHLAYNSTSIPELHAWMTEGFT